MHLHSQSIGGFLMEKGLRQGDPSSPFLLNIAEEGLSKMIEEGCDLGSVEGISGVWWFQILLSSICWRHTYFQLKESLFCSEHQAGAAMLWINLGIESQFFQELYNRGWFGH